MIGLCAYDRIHDGINSRRPRQLGKRHVLRQADGRWRAPHAIPAAHRNPPLGTWDWVTQWKATDPSTPHSLPVPPARPAHCLEARCNPPNPLSARGPSSRALSSEPRNSALLQPRCAWCGTCCRKTPSWSAQPGNPPSTQTQKDGRADGCFCRGVSLDLSSSPLDTFPPIGDRSSSCIAIS